MALLASLRAKIDEIMCGCLKLSKQNFCSSNVLNSMLCYDSCKEQILCPRKLRENPKQDIYVTRPAKIDQVGTFKYLRNANPKYSMPHNSPVPDSSCIRFTQEAQEGNSY